MPDIKQNFFSSQAAPKQEMIQVVLANDPKFRAAFGLWCYDRFDELVQEYKTHGRFLTIQELHESQDVFSDLP